MRPTSGLVGKAPLCAAGGGDKQRGGSAAVEKCEGERKPEAFFGHRKGAFKGGASERYPEVVGSNPSPATMKKQRFVYRTNLCFFNEVALFEG